MPDLSKTSFYGAGRSESLRGPEGPPGRDGAQGPAGPLIPLPSHLNNTSALAAGLPLGTLYATPSGEVRVVIP
jgi:hypothetical protein